MDFEFVLKQVKSVIEFALYIFHLSGLPKHKNELLLDRSWRATASRRNTFPAKSSWTRATGTRGTRSSWPAAGGWSSRTGRCSIFTAKSRGRRENFIRFRSLEPFPWSRCYKTFFWPNLDLPKIKKLKKVCNSACTWISIKYHLLRFELIPPPRSWVWDLLP